MGDTLTTSQILLLAIPLELISLGFMALALVDLIKRNRVKGGNKIIWAAVIIFIQIIGPAVYLMLGREEE